MPWIPPPAARARTIYQLKITLRGLRPLIWRRFEVPGEYTLDRLHRVIQRVMGWTDSHLHEFIVRGRHYGTSDPEWGMRQVESERSARLCCPPEDCGGYPGYIDFVAAISNPKHPEHAEMLEWVGGAFDPWAFDLDAVNRALRRFRQT